MSVLVKNLADFLSLLVQAFNLSAIFPSLLVILLTRRFVSPHVAPSLRIPTETILGPASELGFVIITTILLAYFLEASNANLIRLFEGYTFADQFPFDKQRAKNRHFVEKTVADSELLEVWIRKLRKRAAKEADSQKRDQMEDQANNLDALRISMLTQLQNRYPRDPDFVMALPLGNILAAAEQYPSEVFGMDAITLWPFLCPILTDVDYARFVLREKAILDLMLNLTILLPAFGILLTTFTLQQGIPGIGDRIVIFFALATAVVTYRMALGAASAWGVTIRTAFVLYRDELQKRIGLTEPTNYQEERKLWMEASEFLRAESSRPRQIKLGNRIFK